VKIPLLNFKLKSLSHQQSKQIDEQRNRDEGESISEQAKQLPEAKICDIEQKNGSGKPSLTSIIRLL